jgi:hypothetical protein
MNRRDFLKGILAASAVAAVPTIAMIEGHGVTIVRPLRHQHQYNIVHQAEHHSWDVVFTYRDETYHLCYDRLVFPDYQMTPDLFKFYEEDMLDSMEKKLKQDFPKVDWSTVKWAA